MGLGAFSSEDEVKKSRESSKREMAKVALVEESRSGEMVRAMPSADLPNGVHARYKRDEMRS